MEPFAADPTAPAPADPEAPTPAEPDTSSAPPAAVLTDGENLPDPDPDAALRAEAAAAAEPAPELDPDAGAPEADMIAPAPTFDDAEPGADAEPEPEAEPWPDGEPERGHGPGRDGDRGTSEDADSTHDQDHGAAPEPIAAAQPDPTTVAELVAATLRAAGVRIAFTVAGESFLGVLDALAAAGIRIVATRHEGAAAFAAEAYGQLTGRPAVCLGTRAVGASNLAIGIHTARADSTPMFVLPGQVERAFRGREAFH